jgi:predicted ATP-dependent protease
MPHELSPEQLRRTFDPHALGIETTEHIEPLEGIIGQRRAVSALQFGLGIQELGFNIYVAGPPGIGKMTAVKSFLEELARQKETPPDWCYVNNFEDPYQPKALRLPPGWGARFAQDIKNLIEHVRRELPKVFESEEYSARRDEIVKAINQQREAIINRVQEKASQAGFLLQAAPFGILIVPVLGGRPLSDAEFQSLPQAAREDIQRRRDALQEDLKVAMKEIRALEKLAQERLTELDRQVTLYMVGGLIDDLREKYRELPEVLEYLDALQKDILENIELFKGEQKSEGELPPWAKELPFRKYSVNVLVDNSKQQGAPVVVELNPVYHNLFGRIEKETQFGALYTDFTMIKAGSLHRANGGYLVLPIEDVLRSLLSWDGLKRALRSREIFIEELGERLGFIATKSLRPQPIPLDVKVVLVGHPIFYYLLHAYDEEFPELFKVKADFDTRMDASPENIRDFLKFLCTFCQKERLKHLDNTAVAKLLEHAARLAEDQQKLSTHFGAIADIIREANYWALQEGSSHIRARHVQRALDEEGLSFQSHPRENPRDDRARHPAHRHRGASRRPSQRALRHQSGGITRLASLAELLRASGRGAKGL